MVTLITISEVTDALGQPPFTDCFTHLEMYKYTNRVYRFINLHTHQQIIVLQFSPHRLSHKMR